MQLHDEERYDQFIADYLDGKMTEEEEIAFMEQVSADAALRQRYEQQLDLGWQLQQDDAPAQIAAPPAEAVKPIPTDRTKRAWWYAAAAVAVLATGVYWLLKPTTPAPSVARQAPVAPANNGPIDSPKGISPEKAVTPASTAFAAFYKPYGGQPDDPVELSIVLQQYQQKKHNEVLAAKAADFQLMGDPVADDRIKDYLALYKGLSQLDAGNPDAADALQLLADRSRLPAVAATARWYAALAYLQQGNTGACRRVLTDGIKMAGWPYQQKATSLLALL